MRKNLRMDIKEVFARNLLAAMRQSSDMRTPGELAKRARWPRGNKAGEPISARQIGYAMDTRKDSPSPTLDLVQGVAKALGVQPWELFTDSAESRREILDRLVSGAFVPDAKLTGSPFDASAKPATGPPAPRSSKGSRP